MKTLRKLTFILPVIFLATSAYGDKILMTCMTEFPTTSYQLVEVEEGYRLTVLHHNGTKYLPLHSGVITPNDLPLLIKRAETMKKMGKLSNVLFKNEECSKKGVIWNCFSRRSAKLGELEVESVSFQMGHFKKDYEGYKWETYLTSLSFKAGQENFSMSYEYSPWECSHH